MTTCTRCGATFGCAMADGSTTPCWCTQVPALTAIPAPDSGAGCWCPACLAQHNALVAAGAPATPSS